MTTYFVGPGGSDAALGTSWSDRLLTLNAAEDAHGGGTPKSAIAAGDTVIVAPGVYRELLTLDVSGSAGSLITYIGDVSGALTDGIGGMVRITGSDDDQTETRNNCISSPSRIYRTFRGFCFDTTIQTMVNVASPTHWVIEDCVFGMSHTFALAITGAGQSNVTIRRCWFTACAATQSCLSFSHTSAVDNCGHLVENCVFDGGYVGVGSVRIGGVTVKNCLIHGCYAGGVRVSTALTAGQTITVNNSAFDGCGTAMIDINAGEITEDYNSIYACGTARSAGVATGAHSNTHPSLPKPPILVNGVIYPYQLGQLSQWSQIKAIAGTGEATDDLYGLTRPATSAKKSWGPVQYQGQQRSAVQAQAGTYSLNLPDAGIVQMIVPANNVSTIFSVQTYHEADYDGTLPQMIIRQPGQADTVITDTGEAGGWNLLTATLTPAAAPNYVTVLLVSNNTAISGSYNTYFDSLVVS